jgi:hypothetical protein
MNKKVVVGAVLMGMLGNVGIVSGSADPAEVLPRYVGIVVSGDSYRSLINQVVSTVNQFLSAEDAAIVRRNGDHMLRTASPVKEIALVKTSGDVLYRMLTTGFTAMDQEQDELLRNLIKANLAAWQCGSMSVCTLDELPESARNARHSYIQAREYVQKYIDRTATHPAVCRAFAITPGVCCHLFRDVCTHIFQPVCADAEVIESVFNGIPTIVGQDYVMVTADTLERLYDDLVAGLPVDCALQCRTHKQPWVSAVISLIAGTQCGCWDVPTLHDTAERLHTHVAAKLAWPL